MPKVIQVIEALEREGRGTNEDPARMVARYYTLEGDLLFERDPWEEEKKQKEADEKDVWARRISND